jgi:endonuclease YncB( thermonuclease family)
MNKYKAIMHEVVDGNTIRAHIFLGFGIWIRGQSIQLLGYNAPDKWKKEKEALEIKEYLEKLLPQNEKIVIWTNKDKRGKYGRILAIIYKEGKNINELVIKEKSLLIQKNENDLKDLYEYHKQIKGTSWSI